MTKKVNIGPKSNVIIRWDVSPLDYSPEKKSEIVNLFANKYEISNKKVSLVTNFVNKNNGGDIVLNNDIKNVHDPIFQQSLFEVFLKNEGIKEYNLDALCAIDSKVNSLVDYDAYNNGKRWNIEWIEWKNFLSFGDNNFFDFTKLSGIVQLTGEPANESGKSTFANDLIHFLLFGKVSVERSKTLDGLFNNYLKEETELIVKGCISIEGEKYVIERILTRQKYDSSKPKKARTVTNKVNFYKLLENDNMELVDSENLQEETTTKTSKIIKEAIGSEDDFDMIISANAKDLDTLISMKDTERGKTITKWNGLGILEKKEEVAKELWKNEKKGRYCDMYTISGLNNNIDEYNKANEDYRVSIQNEENIFKNANNEITKITSEKESYLKLMSTIDTSVAKVDITTLKNVIETIIEDGKRKGAELESNKNLLSEYGEIEVDEDGYIKMVKKKEELIANIASIKANYKLLTNKKDSLKKAEYCPTCGRKLENVDNSKLISDIEIQLNELIENGKKDNEEKDKLTNKIEVVEKNRKLLQEKNKLELKKAAIEVQIANLRAEYKEKKLLLKKAEEYQDAILKNNEITNKINVLNASIAEFEAARKSSEIKIFNYNNEIKQNITKIEEAKKIIEKIKEELKNEYDWGLYLKLIGKDGISKMVLVNAIPIMNAELHRLLSDCADFDVEISMNEKKDIEFNLIRDGIVTKLSAASGLERTLSALAIRVVLGKMSNLSRPPFILLDEVLATVNKENYDKVVKLFNKIKTEYSFILHICHLDELAELHDGGTVTISKKNNVSYIKE